MLCASERKAPFSLAVGTQSIGVRYQFSNDCALVESAREIAALGSDTLKIAITPRYEDDYKMSADPSIRSVIDLVQRKPSFLEVMDMPFRNVMLWVYPFSDTKSAFFKGRISPNEREAIYRELYDFTVYLLKRYAGSGKSFFIGNWEGDWHMLKERYDYNLDPEPESINGTIEWFRIREKAVAEARRATPHEGVEVYFYVELNHVAKSMDHNRPTIVNTVLPHIKTDFVSWSSYDVTKAAAVLGEEAGRARVFRALDYIEANLPDSNIPGKRVFIGEYGFELSSFKSPELQHHHTASIMKWALDWGCPFVLYWELYCNEVDRGTGEHRGYWLIDDTGTKQPVWFLHKKMLDRANAYVATYKEQNGVLPPQALFNQQAVSWMAEASAGNVQKSPSELLQE